MSLTNRDSRQQRSWLIDSSFLLILAGLAYLPYMAGLKFYLDDWYYALDGTLGGPGVFYQMFMIDRPLRGFVFDAYFRLFGINPLPYHISELFWRLLAALAALCLVRMLWPGRRWFTWMIAVLFILYPGYWWWVAGIEYQPMVMSLFLEILSIGLTVWAVKSTSFWKKLILWTGAIFTGWAYIGLVDYAIGMEVFRFICVFLIVNRQSAGSWVLRLVRAIRAWAIALVIPVGFLFWHTFLFNNTRPATDLALQLGRLIRSPLQTALWWLLSLGQSTVNTLVMAWLAPGYIQVNNLRLHDYVVVFLMGGLALLCLGLAAVYFSRRGVEKEVKTGIDWPGELIWVGIIGGLFGVLPVVMGNRAVVFDPFSYYALPASLMGAIFITGIIASFNTIRKQALVFAALTFLAVISQNSLAAKVSNQYSSLEQFWWQMAWRAPEIRRGVTLLANYPDKFVGQDVDIINGPANLIYYPTRTDQAPVVYPITELPTLTQSTQVIVSGGQIDLSYRSHTSQANLDQLLVISQPTVNACVHVLDARWPELSMDDNDQMRLVAPYSNIDGIVPRGEPPKLSEMLFGPEPQHDWCYYYEKAEMALQAGDMRKVVDLGDQAAAKGFHPDDRVEWMPFLLAHAFLGDEGWLRQTAPKVNDFRLLHVQICASFKQVEESGHSLTPAVQKAIDEEFCN